MRRIICDVVQIELWDEHHLSMKRLLYPRHEVVAMDVVWKQLSRCLPAARHKYV